MAVTSHRKVSRKSLKQPDEFVSTLDKVGDWVANNLFRVILGAVAVVVLIAIVFSFSFYSQHRQRVASRRFYRAINALSDKNYAAAERGFSKLVQRGASGPLGRLSGLYLASAYLAQNQPAKARDAVRTYLAEDGNRLFQQIALTQLGVCNEDLGEYRDAHTAYVKAAGLNGPEKARAEMGVARTLAKLGDRMGAIKAYQQFLRENPFSRQRDEVSEALALMGAPAAPALNETASPSARPTSSSTSGH